MTIEIMEWTELDYAKAGNEVRDCIHDSENEINPYDVARVALDAVAYKFAPSQPTAELAEDLAFAYEANKRGPTMPTRGEAMSRALRAILPDLEAQIRSELAGAWELPITPGELDAIRTVLLSIPAPRDDVWLRARAATHKLGDKARGGK